MLPTSRRGTATARSRNAFIWVGWRMLRGRGGGCCAGGAADAAGRGDGCRGPPAVGGAA